MLLASLHLSGLATLTHTPSPMGFLNAALGRPKHEKAYMVVVVGLPDENAMVPDIHKYQLDEITSFDPK